MSRVEESGAGSSGFSEVGQAVTERWDVKPRVLGLSLIVIVLIGWSLRRAWCGESLWIDELYSSWVVSGGYADLLQRCDVGFQPAGYFSALWGWCQLVGITEWTLRLPSILLSLIACLVITVSGIQLTGRWIVGLVAGVSMAVERNSLFYGTEAGGSATVLLMVTLIYWGVLALLTEGLFRFASGRGKLLLVGIFLASTAAVLIQPSSAFAIIFIGVAAVAIAAYQLIVSYSDSRALPEQIAAFRFETRILFVILLLITWGGVVCAGCLRYDSIVKAWEFQAQLKNVPSPMSLVDTLRAGPWVGCLVIPFIFANVLPFSWRREGATEGRSWHLFIALAIAVGLTMLVSWGVSRMGEWPLWQRGGVVGILPGVYLIAGLLWGIFFGRCRFGGRLLLQAWKRRGLPHQEYIEIEGEGPLSAREIGFAVLVLSLSVSMLGLTDRVWGLFLEGQRLEVRRGEDWRGVARFLANNHVSGDRILLDAGLAEAGWFVDPNSAAESADLRSAFPVFPLQSIYRIESLEPDSLIPAGSITARNFPAGWLERSDDYVELVRGSGGNRSNRGLWLVVRANPQTAQRAIERWMEAWNGVYSGREVLEFEGAPRAFGKIYVAYLRGSAQQPTAVR